MKYLTMKAFNMFLLGLYLMLVKAGLILCKNQTFTVAFMTNIGYYCLELSLFFAATGKTKCLVSAPKASFEEEIYIGDPSRVSVVNLPRSLALSRSGVERKGIKVNCNTSVTLYGINSCSYNTDGFFVIPNDRLGRKYYAFTVKPTYSKSQVAMVSYLDNTTVTVHLRCSDCNVLFNNVDYISGSLISVVLDAYECFQIQSDGNLTGVYISSNNPVSVFSGNIKSGVNGESSKDHLVLHMQPMQTWGKQFAVVSTPSAIDTASISNTLFVVASTDYTSCSILCTGTDGPVVHHHVVNAGQIIQKAIFVDVYCSIETNETVLAIQAISPEKSPSFLLLTPIDCYSTNYSFMTPKTSTGSAFANYFVYVIEESAASGLMLDSNAAEINDEISMKIPGTNLIGGYFPVTDNSHKVTHSYAQFYGAILGFGLHESYAVSLGWNWKDSTITDISNPPFLTTDQASQDTTDKIQTTVLASQNTFTAMSTTVQTTQIETTGLTTTVQTTESTSAVSTTIVFASQGTSTGSTMTVSASQELMDCQCPCSSLSTKLQEFLRGNVTKEEFVIFVLTDFEQNIKPSIMIDRTKLSQTKRKKISVMNIDATAHHIGWGFSWIVVVPIALAVLSDILNLCRYCARRMKQNY